MTPAVREIILFGGIGYPFVNAEARAFVARMEIKPSSARMALIDTMFGSLKASGWFPSRADFIHVHASHHAQAYPLNLVGPTYPIIPQGALTWTVDRGTTGNGTSTFGATTHSSALLNTKMLQDSAVVGVFARTDVAGTTYEIGSANSRTRIHNGITTAATVRSSGTVTAVAGTAAAPRHVAVNRTASNLTTLFINGIADGTGATASAGLTTTLNYHMDGASATFNANQIAAGYAGASFVDGTQALAVHNAINTFLHAIGAT